jgi:hypothetical protein
MISFFFNHKLNRNQVNKSACTLLMVKNTILDKDVV